MPTFIEISGDLVTLYERSEAQVCKLSDLLPHLATTPTLTTPHLPRNTVFLHHDETNNQIALVVELEPGLRHLKTETMAVGYKLAMPWQYFTFTLTMHDSNHWTFTDYFVHWSRTRVTSTTQATLVRACVPNVYADGRICFGSTAPDSNRTIAERIDTIINDFYGPNSEFNNDLGWNRPNGFENFRAWAAESKADPFCWTIWHELSESVNGHSLADLFSGTWDRSKPVTVDNAIPELPINPTFGRAAEWLGSLTGEDRWLLAEALQKLDPSLTLIEPAPTVELVERDDDPELTTTPAPTAPTADDEIHFEDEATEIEYSCACTHEDCTCDNRTLEGFLDWVCTACEDGDHDL